MSEKIVPYQNSDNSKKEQVAEMFNNIASSYDFLNHFFSLGIDILWRKKAVKMLKKSSPKTILDIATGTGDFAVSLSKLNPDSITGVDISEGMMEVGKVKVKKKNLDKLISFKYGDSENLPFEDNYFDALTVGFGVRNYENLKKGLADMLRVTKPDGTVLILEFSKPKKFPIKQLFKFYFKFIMPIFGKILSKDNKAYTYLPESVQAFPEGEEFVNILGDLGYKNVTKTLVSGGIATIYTGKK